MIVGCVDEIDSLQVAEAPKLLGELATVDGFVKGLAAAESVPGQCGFIVVDREAYSTLRPEDPEEYTLPIPPSGYILYEV